MRKAFIQSLIKLASIDERIMLLTGDLGYLVIEEFIEQFPGRFFNVGVAEQNMVGLATGLAEAGFIPFIYSITPFVTLRPFEFIRNGPIYHQLPIRIVGVGQGVEYGFNGHSHYALEDVGVFRTQPGIIIIAPADDAQARSAIEQTSTIARPIYFRLSKDPTDIPELNGNFALGQAQQIGNGNDALLVSSGAITKEVIKAAHLLTQQRILTTILVVSCISPAPLQTLTDMLASFRYTFTVESHSITGGIGSLASEIVAEHCLNTQLIRLGFNSVLDEPLGNASFMHHMHNLSADKIAQCVMETIREHA